jgi:CubicO group peptidase (beta-lactamase class C family)
MYTVAAYLVERMSGLTFSDFLENHLFRPLAMHSTNLQPKRARAKGLGDRIATGYFWDKKAGKYQAIPYSDSPEAQGAGRIITSANDYIKWIKAMMKQEGPITESVYKGLIERRISLDPPADNDREPDRSQAYYAVGWQILEYRGYMMVSHDGWDDGFVSTHFFLPDLKFGGVILSNSDHASDVVSTLTYKMVDWTVQAQQSRGLLDMMIALELEPGSKSEDDDDGSSIEFENQLRKELCPAAKEKMPQIMPLSAYMGQYWNPGYRCITVEDKNSTLFVDATDRSFPFTLTFEHVCEQTKYIVYMNRKTESGNYPIKAEFRLTGDQAVELLTLG